MAPGFGSTTAGGVTSRDVATYRRLTTTVPELLPMIAFRAPVRLCPAVSTATEPRAGCRLLIQRQRRPLQEAVLPLHDAGGVPHQPCGPTPAESQPRGSSLNRPDAGTLRLGRAVWAVCSGVLIRRSRALASGLFSCQSPALRSPLMVDARVQSSRRHGWPAPSHSSYISRLSSRIPRDFCRSHVTISVWSAPAGSSRCASFQSSVARPPS